MSMNCVDAIVRGDCDVLPLSDACSMVCSFKKDIKNVRIAFPK